VTISFTRQALLHVVNWLDMLQIYDIKLWF